MNSDLDAELAEGIALVRAFRAATARGARVNNLYQAADGRWRCNVIGATGAAEFAEAPLASQAVLASIDKLPKGGGSSEGEEEGRTEVLTEKPAGAQAPDGDIFA